ncbi:unnamed protein product [Allacma fusca]|uniref:Endocuticle structural glycoprotein SgAbd-2 n=1 Tax=Allacma fusca TaxID=39272 RepID=A0A8J2KMT9_9HEXA|nr:unnamed protein product [Allacma fusca]
MQTILFLALCGLGIFAVTEGKPPVIPITELDVKLVPAGPYDVKAVGADGQQTLEKGTLKDLGDKGGPVSVKSGEFSYPSKTGTVNEKWTADEKGFVAEGSHIPTSPPIPEAIRRELEENHVKPPFGPGSS